MISKSFNAASVRAIRIESRATTFPDPHERSVTTFALSLYTITNKAGRIATGCTYGAGSNIDQNDARLLDLDQDIDLENARIGASSPPIVVTKEHPSGVLAGIG